jgi:ABC-type lipoprotein export system ATPase subunit
MNKDLDKIKTNENNASGNADNEIILSLKGITKDFHDGGRLLNCLKGVDLEVAREDTVAILGSSGSGKSTLLHIIGLMDRMGSGEYFLSGENVSGISESKRKKVRNKNIGFVFQHFHLLPELNVLENVLLPSRIAGISDKGRAVGLLGKLKISDKAGKKPSTLSGGEMQRVAIARALINKPEILLCDEPTGNLDNETAEVVLDLFMSLVEEEGVTLITVTHDMKIARRHNRILSLHNGLLKILENRLNMSTFRV